MQRKTFLVAIQIAGVGNKRGFYQQSLKLPVIALQTVDARHISVAGKIIDDYSYCR